MTAGNRDLWNGYYTVEKYRASKRQEWLDAQRPPARAMPKTPKKRAKIAKALAAGSISANPCPAEIKSATEEPGPKPVTTCDYMRINRQRLKEGKEPL